MSTLWCTARQLRTLSCSSGALLTIEEFNIIWEFWDSQNTGGIAIQLFILSSYTCAWELVLNKSIQGLLYFSF